MKTMLIAGEEHETLVRILQRRAEVVNKTAIFAAEAAEALRSSRERIERVIVTDGALVASPVDNGRFLDDIVSVAQVPVVVVTRDNCLGTMDDRIRRVFVRWFRATEADLLQALKNQGEKAAKGRDADIPKPSKLAKDELRDSDSTKKKRFSLGRMKNREDEDDGKKAENISFASHKVIVFTGRRGSGVTSTAVNVAKMASLKGISTILIDLDTVFRAANLYFERFNEQAEEDETIRASLVRTLAQPQDWRTTALDIDQNLWVTSLGYEFEDDALLEKFYIGSRIVAMLSALKRQFNFVAVDCPLDVLAAKPEIMDFADAFALCVENNIYALISTFRSMMLSFEKGEYITYLNAKAKLVATKHNSESIYDGKVITAERLSELATNMGFCEFFTQELPIAGAVQYIPEFDRQIETDVPICVEDSRMRAAYDKIVLRLLGDQ